MADVQAASKSRERKSKKAGTVPVLSPFVDRVLVPGDQAIDLHSVAEAAQAPSGKSTAAPVLRLGSGLRQDESHVIAMRAGTLRTVRQKKFWLESSGKRYTPALEEEALGIVVEKHSENFDVDIKGPSLAILPVLAFESATRRNRPNIEVGAAVYCRVTKTHPDAQPELSCVDASGKSSGFGPLIGGFIFDCTTGLARSLLSLPRPAVLDALGAAASFELAVGLNGRVWVKGESPQITILAVKALQESEGRSQAQQMILVRDLVQAHKQKGS